MKASTAGQSAEVAVCKALEAYPSYKTVAAAKKFAAFLFKEASKNQLTAALANAIERFATDLTAFLTGLGTQKQVEKDARKLQAVCTSYGVSG